MTDNPLAGQPWTGGRLPLADRASEADRVAAYWVWMNSSRPSPGSLAQEVGDAGAGRRWVELATADDADFEALHMEHSIGHSWANYSGIGRIFSLRSPAGLPEATVLVAGGAVVHAREHRNARLSGANEAALHALAATMGWTVQDDPLAFDVLRDPEAPNTRLTYLRREADGSKSFGQATFAGKLSDQQVAEIAEALPGGKVMDPGWVGLPGLGGLAAADCELSSLRDTHDEPDRHVTSDVMCAELLQAARDHAPPATAPVR